MKDMATYGHQSNLGPETRDGQNVTHFLEQISKQDGLYYERDVYYSEWRKVPRTGEFTTEVRGNRVVVVTQK